MVFNNPFDEEFTKKVTFSDLSDDEPAFVPDRNKFGPDLYYCFTNSRKKKYKDKIRFYDEISKDLP